MLQNRKIYHSCIHEINDQRIDIDYIYLIFITLYDFVFLYSKLIIIFDIFIKVFLELQYGEKGNLFLIDVFKYVYLGSNILHVNFDRISCLFDHIHHESCRNKQFKYI